MKKPHLLSSILAIGLLLAACSNQSEEVVNPQPTSETTANNQLADTNQTATVTPGTKIQLEGSLNTRDLGGYETLDGKVVKPDMLIRSGSLEKLTEQDIQTLVNDYQIKNIIDLRTEAEVAKDPEIVINGVTNKAIPLLKDTKLGITHENKTKLTDPADILLAYVDTMGGDVEAYNVKSYPELVTEDYSIGQLKSFFEYVLANEDGAVLYHCTAGKDRAGTATALLLSVLGVDREIVIEDFLKSNEFLKPKIDGTVKLASQKTSDEQVLANVRLLQGVNESYIQAVFQTIDEQYGSVSAFFEQELDITKEQQDELKSKYLM